MQDGDISADDPIAAQRQRIRNPEQKKRKKLSTNPEEENAEKAMGRNRVTSKRGGRGLNYKKQCEMNWELESRLKRNCKRKKKPFLIRSRRRREEWGGRGEGRRR